MSKFARTQTAPARKTGPTKTKKATRTHEGGAGYEKGDKTALFTLAVAGFMGGENTFYESGSSRDSRFVDLVHKVTKKDPEWMQKFIPWLRDEANMRTGAVMAAVEYVAAGGPNGRAVIDGACVRADEPAEIVAYYISRYGRKLPQPVKRGVADAARRLYNERSVLKWDSRSAVVRMGDVVAMTHPVPTADWQSNLFTYLGDVRHNRPDPRTEGLTTIENVLAWRENAAAGKVSFDLPDGVTWEALSSHTKMDAKAWEAMIPKMGYMALLRNLRNFAQAGISEEMEDYVINRLRDPEQVAKSRQLPFRFYAAYKNAESVTYGRAIEKALNLSMSNVPRFGGRTLIAVDTSGSMTATMSNNSSMQCVEAGALFGAAVAAASDNATLIAYGTTWAPVNVKPSVLKTVGAIRSTNVGYGTNTWPSVEKAWKKYGPFDRVLVFTDMQDHPSRSRGLPANVPVFVWDLAGYRAANIETGTNRYLLGGLSDQSFKTVQMLESFKPGSWPWES